MSSQTESDAVRVIVVGMVGSLRDSIRQWMNKCEFTESDRRFLLQHLRSIAAEVDGGTPDEPTAVSLGRKGGLKGGKARAAKMSKEERVASAKKAAEARWKPKKECIP